MKRLAPPLLAVVAISALSLAGCASSESDLAKLDATHQMAKTEAGLPNDVESSVRQAQALRLAGRYDEAVRMLSQVMLVASDDPRVLGEYGKTLAEKGRAQDAVQFLTRAVEIQPTDWTTYNALGVAYDQVGNQPAAKSAYEHALQLRPGEPSVLNNYALSRMLANDPANARALMARAHIAGGEKDPKIARNMEMLKDLAPAPDAPQNLAYAVTKPAPGSTSGAAPVAAPRAMAAAPIAAPTARVATTAPAPMPAPMTVAPQKIAAAPVKADANRVVMQAVPFDPLAGPVKAAAHAPRAIAPKIANAEPVKDSKDTKDAAMATASAMAKNVLPAEQKPAPAKAAAKASKDKPYREADEKGVAIGPPLVMPVIEPHKTAAKPADDKKEVLPTLRKTASAY